MPPRSTALLLGLLLAPALLATAAARGPLLPWLQQQQGGGAGGGSSGDGAAALVPAPAASTPANSEHPWFCRCVADQSMAAPLLITHACACTARC